MPLSVIRLPAWGLICLSACTLRAGSFRLSLDLQRNAPTWSLDRVLSLERFEDWPLVFEPVSPMVPSPFTATRCSPATTAAATAPMAAGTRGRSTPASRFEPPVVVGDTAIFGTQGGRVFAVQVRDGRDCGAMRSAVSYAVDRWWPTVASSSATRAIKSTRSTCRRASGCGATRATRRPG